MNRIKYFLDEGKSIYLEVDFETYTDVSDVQETDYIDINGISLGGLMSININQVPRDLRQNIETHIKENPEKWEGETR